MWIDIALYTSAFSVFLIIMFIIIYLIKSKELKSKLKIYEEYFESLNQDIIIMKKSINQRGNYPNTPQTPAIDMAHIERKIKNITKDEINQSLVPILECVQEFSTSFKAFRDKTNDKFSNIGDKPTKNQISSNANLNHQDVILQMNADGLSLSDIESKTGISVSEIRFILKINGG